MPVDYNILRNHEFFTDCSDEDLRGFSETCEPTSVSTNSPLRFSNVNGKCFYLILDGAFITYCETSYPVKNRNKSYLLCFRSQKHIVIGEFTLAENHVLPQSETTAILDSRLVQISNNSFEKLLLQYPILYKKLFQAGVRKLVSERNQDEAIQLESKLPYDACIARSLTAIAEDLGTISGTNDNEGFAKIKGKVMLEDLQAYISEKTKKNVKGKMNFLRYLGLIKFNEVGDIFIHQAKMDEFLSKITEFQGKTEKKRVEKLISESEFAKNLYAKFNLFVDDNKSRQGK